ncbi:uncharacterized protein Z519_05821 [Cladophialophora bantiana CBS 173.52]|uniref:Uncharacterized protein n=1 Tax=Cladophialophora bantiana (strain ATCC 10958 / CBS 173.52 / CDC B-1940 / NIH 8579) TaxID=1442370 RepID=A0A0D2ETG1_CLAB1|nr:uncharacterized protein Z519_05821 [Cladophialophora bantiana CBS 173.52]KIW93216.1 hypothetical protein Z519_05821 [Cladophialophora bantiana CBS 173.52]
MQGFNMGRYVPPDLEGVVSFNTASGKGHALGSRARKLKTEGVLIVRFECPFAIWCTHCRPEQIIGQGVRFNAEKKRVGNYFSTPIWSFRFKHAACGGWLEVRTDPKNAEYVVIEGGRRRDTGVDKVLDGEIRIGATEEDKERLERDGGFGALEKKVRDKTLFDSQKDRLEGLLRVSERDWADPYEQSKRLRAEFRVGRRKRQVDEKTGEALKEKFGLGLDILPGNAEDGERAKFAEFREPNEGSSTSLRKPMFRTDLDDTHLAPSSSPSHSKSSTAAKPANKREILQSTLQSNTRVASDPFLREEDIWQPRVKRKKQDQGETEQRKEERTKLENSTALVVGYDSDSS